jgi:hypothetical protein
MREVLIGSADGGECLVDPAHLGQGAGLVGVQ